MIDKQIREERLSEASTKQAEIEGYLFSYDPEKTIIKGKNPEQSELEKTIQEEISNVFQGKNKDGLTVFYRNPEIIEVKNPNEINDLIPNNDRYPIRMQGLVQYSIPQENDTQLHFPKYLQSEEGIGILPFESKEGDIELYNTLSDLEIHMANIETASLPMIEMLENHYSQDQTDKIGDFVELFGKKHGLNELQTEQVVKASQVHDGGKLYISEDIIKKPDQLNDEEWDEIEKHPRKGAKIFEEARYRAPLFRMMYEATLDHHEEWDGSGYPNGKKEDQISYAGLITSIADDITAMMVPRDYREPKAFPFEKIYNIVKDSEGKYHPELRNIFLDDPEDFRDKVVNYQEENGIRTYKR